MKKIMLEIVSALLVILLAVAELFLVLRMINLVFFYQWKQGMEVYFFAIIGCGFCVNKIHRILFSLLRKIMPT
jgi:hypothetical protein